jgi:predicted outer membrane repeat protein
MNNRLHCRRRPIVSRPRRTHLNVECLEDRSVPAVYTVNSLVDLGIANGVDNANGQILDAQHHDTGVVTLRSAIEAANHTPGGNTIDLGVAGIYRIQLAPTTANESDNQAGELAILPEGNLTIQNTSGGAVAIDGNQLSRVFDINPANTNNDATHFTDTFIGFTVTGGRAFDATGEAPDGAVASGGGIRDQGNQSLTLDNVVVTNNSATADGGGISMENLETTPWTLTINNSTVCNNQAGDAGGGVETDGSGKVVITDSVISNNTCVNQGAGIWLDAIGNDSAILTITNSLVSGNTAINGPTGGIGNAGNNTFVAADGTVTSGAVTIIGSTVANNFSGNGGGMGVGGGGFGDENGLGTLVVLNSTFVGNSTTGVGGGIFEGGPSTTINDSTITGNTAGIVGGGLYVTESNAPTFILNNTIVAGNFANNGGMNFQGFDPDYLGVVTSGQGNFIGVGGPNFEGIVDGINGNHAGTPTAQLNPDLGRLQNNGGPVVGGLNFTQVLPTEAPLPGSPVIDAGVNGVIPTGTTTDQRGFHRIVNHTVDIGAVEYQPPATTTTLTAPPLVTSGDPILLTATVTANTPDSNPVLGSVIFTVDGVPVGVGVLNNGVATFTLSALPPGGHTLGATYSGSPLFAASTGTAGESVAPANIPNANVPDGTVLSAPVNNFVSVTVTTVKKHGKKFLELVVANNTGVFIVGRLVLSGLSLKQFGMLLGLNAKQFQAIRTFNGAPVIDVFLLPGGRQTIQVPAGNTFTPLVVAGL